ncbi:MAG: DUF2207 domain-containing protein, partial [Devosia sp.]
MGLILEARWIADFVPAITRRLSVVLMVLVVTALPALSAEAIQSFDSKVTMATDGTVDVVETITVNSEGDQIRHGIYRDIPTQLINPDKSRQRSDLSIRSVFRDGQQEPYSIEG